MCARFEPIFNFEGFNKYCGLSIPPIPSIDSMEKRPTDESIVITGWGKASSLIWGFHTDWSPKPLINARTETLFEKQTFHATQNTRCLVPTQAWYEWRKSDGNKYKNRIALSGYDNFAMAAIHDGHRFCILTCAPAPEIAYIHNRMPVLIAPNFYESWLDNTVKTRQLSDLLCAPNGVGFNITEEKPTEHQMALF